MRILILILFLLSACASTPNLPEAKVCKNGNFHECENACETFNMETDPCCLFSEPCLGTVKEDDL